MIWLWLLLLLGCSAAVSGSETALFGLTQQMRVALARSTNPAQRLAALLMQHPQRVLMTVLIANTAVNVAIYALSFILIEHNYGAQPVTAGLLSVGVLIGVIAFGEIVPKTAVISNPRFFAPFAGLLIGILQSLLTPVRWFLRVLVVAPLVRLLSPSSMGTGPVTAQELRVLVEQSAHEGVIDLREHDLLQAVVAAGSVSVREVMTPRVDMRAVYLGRSRRQLVEEIRRLGRRRIPVYGRDLDDIRGFLNTRDVLLRTDQPLRSLLQPMHYVPEQANLLHVLRYFREHKVEFAVVVDEYGGTAGFCSLNDIVEWVVGDIPDDESDEPAVPETERIDAYTYRVSGKLSARIWAERFAVGELQQRADTVGGLVLAMLGRMPRPGDLVRLENVTLSVERVRRRRIERLLVRLEHNGSPVETPRP